MSRTLIQNGLAPSRGEQLHSAAGMADGTTEPTTAPELRFEALYAEHFGFVWRCLQGLGVPRDRLDDAAQDVFVVVHRRLGDFRGASSVRTWLYGIVRNVAANTRRSQRRQGELVTLDETQHPLRSHAPGPHEQAQEREAADFVQSFLARTDEGKREVFVLAMLEQLSMPEVAEALQIPINTAYSRLRTVKTEFHAALERRGRRT